MEQKNKAILDFDEDMELDLRTLIRNILNKKFWIIGAAILGMVGGIAFAKIKKKPTYDAGFAMYVISEKDENQITADESADVLLKVNTAGELLKSGEVLNEVIQNTNLSEEEAQTLRSTVKPSVKTQTQIIEVVVSMSDAETTERVIKELAMVAPEKISQLMKGQATVKIITPPGKVRVTPVPLKSFGLKGFMAGFGLSFLIVVALALFDHQYPKKKSDE